MWWNATSLQIWWRNKLILIMDGLKESIHFHFWLNYSFNSILFKRHLLENETKIPIRMICVWCKSPNIHKQTKRNTLTHIRRVKGLSSINNLVVNTNNADDTQTIAHSEGLFTESLQLRFCVPQNTLRCYPVAKEFWPSLSGLNEKSQIWSF